MEGNLNPGLKNSHMQNARNVNLQQKNAGSTQGDKLSWAEVSKTIV